MVFCWYWKKGLSLSQGIVPFKVGCSKINNCCFSKTCEAFGDLARDNVYISFIYPEIL